MKTIRRRIKSVESTMQITKAMELVASSKLRKAKERVEKARPFFNILYKTIVEIALSNKDFSSVYTKEQNLSGKIGLIVVAGDRGLAGGYNSNVLKHALSLAKDKDVLIIPIGKKVGEFFSKRGFEVYDTGFATVEELGLDETYEIAEMVSELYKDHTVDELHIVYTEFISVLSQSPRSKKILPLSFGDDLADEMELNHLSTNAVEFEPSVNSVFEMIVPQYIGGLIYGAVVESYASEQGARRTAMENATDSAEEIIENLNLKFNRARQSAITQEINEIVSGAQALK